MVETLMLSGSTVYVGGEFTSVGGQQRNRIAALDAQAGIATGWNKRPVLIPTRGHGRFLARIMRPADFSRYQKAPRFLGSA